jgi:hypothetical protein
MVIKKELIFYCRKAAKNHLKVSKSIKPLNDRQKV